MVTKNKTLLKISAKKVTEPFIVGITADKKISQIKWEVYGKCGIEVSGIREPNEKTEEFSESFNAVAWSVEEPNLYTFKAEITFDDGQTEEIEDRFGYRYFDCDEKYIYLNGFPFYMRAYIRGAAAHEHQNNCNLSEFDFYKKNIEMAKSYGFNTIRFHSVIPPRECFEAADELGILIHIEMRKEKTEYDNLQEMLYGKNDFVSDEELLNIINDLYNHPSFMVYCVGNEIREPGKKPRIREIRDFIKKHDPNRLFIDTCAHGEYDRDYVDFDVQHMGYFFPYGRNKNMFSDTDNLLCFGNVNNLKMTEENENSKIRRGIAFQRPLIAHEVCHYTSWRDFYALREKFIKFNRPLPWWIDEEIKMIEAKGYKEGFKDTLQITKDYQFRCWKTALEGIRASNLLSGFHMLQFADTDKYENSNGVVDCFDDPHGISQEEFRKFNADTVLLARLPKQIYNDKEVAKIPVLLSQYMINPPSKADFSYKAEDIENNIVFEGKLSDVETKKSGIYEILSLELKIPKVTNPKKLKLSLRLDFCDGTSCENDWEMWIFPEVKKLELDAVSGMEATYLNKICDFSKNSDLLVTDKINDDLFKQLEDGKNALLIYRTDWTRHLLDKSMNAPKYSLRAVWERYKGVIWDRGTINGGSDDKDLLNKFGFVTDGQINFQYYPLVEDSDKINLDDFPVKVKSIVSGLDKSSRDRFDPSKFNLPELMYDRTMRHFTYAFEVSVGNGKLLITGFNFTGIENSEPASCAMLNTLVKYCNSDEFNPSGKLTLEEFKNYLEKVASEGPQKERMMTQYWQLDEEPVESMDYWTESERYLKE